MEPILLIQSLQIFSQVTFKILNDKIQHTYIMHKTNSLYTNQQTQETFTSKNFIPSVSSLIEKTCDITETHKI